MLNALLHFCTKPNTERNGGADTVVRNSIDTVYTCSSFFPIVVSASPVIIGRNFTGSSNYGSVFLKLFQLQFNPKNLEGRNYFRRTETNPFDVRSQRGSFDEAFKGHQHKFPEDPQKVQKWRDSLAKVAKLSGFDSRQYRYETELIDGVVDRLRVQLHSKLTHGAL
ncbi:hypothetical protein K1719_047007 [Acacia pycnantha]|nr:hypothetical protein K1719_047007 [Acacia pycnantha]